MLVFLSIYADRNDVIYNSDLFCVKENDNDIRKAERRIHINISTYGIFEVDVSIVLWP